MAHIQLLKIKVVFDIFIKKKSYHSETKKYFLACEFAGIQVHIQFGDYNESKHKTGFLE